MKNDNLTTALNLVLAVLAILGVIFALQTIFRTRTLRTMQIQATQANAYRMAVDALAQDAVAYSQKNPNPDIQCILHRVLFINCIFPIFVLHSYQILISLLHKLLCMSNIIFGTIFMKATKGIGQRIRIVRGDKSQFIFAAELGIHRNTLLRYEDELSHPDSDIISKICKTYDINSSWLLFGTGLSFHGKIPIEGTKIASEGTGSIFSPPQTRPLKIDTRIFKPLKQ